MHEVWQIYLVPHGQWVLKLPEERVDSVPLAQLFLPQSLDFSYGTCELEVLYDFLIETQPHL